MKKITLTLIFILSLLNTYSNGNLKEEYVVNENQYEKLFDLAKSYFKENPEYAFICLYKAYIIAEENNDNKKMAECNIILGDIFKENNSYPTAISYYGKAIDNLLYIEDYHSVCKMYINIAKLYQNSEFENKWSIEAMNNALKNAKKINDKNLLNETYLTFGNLYSSQNKYDIAIEYYNEILKNDIDINTINIITKTLTDKTNVLIKQKEYEKAINIIDSTLYLCIRDFNDSLQIINYSYKANIYDSIGDFESAKKYYIHAAKLAYSTKDFHNCGKNMFSLAYLNQKNEKYNEAINVLHIICDSTEKFKMYDICYQSYYRLSQCYASLEKYEEAYNTFNKYDHYFKSIFTQSQEDKINKLRNSFLLSLNIKELKTKELEDTNLRNDKNSWMLFVSIIIVLTLILITFAVLYLNYKTMFNKNKVKTYEQELKINKIESDLMEYKMRSNRESMINMALHLKSYIELMAPLKDDLKLAMELPEKEQKNKIKNIYMNIQNNMLTINNTDNLNKQIDAVYKDFINKLDEKHPGLTKSEKKLCTMLFVNMSSKEIATLTKTTIRSVETSRYRLRKKIGLLRDEDIVDFLQNI